MKSKSFEQAVKIAADPIAQLRRPDVFRVLEERPVGMDMDSLAEWLVQQRPDLVDEVQDCLSDLRGADDFPTLDELAVEAERGCRE